MWTATLATIYCCFLPRFLYMWTALNSNLGNNLLKFSTSFLVHVNSNLSKNLLMFSTSFVAHVNSNLSKNLLKSSTSFDAHANKLTAALATIYCCFLPPFFAHVNQNLGNNLLMFYTLKRPPHRCSRDIWPVPCALCEYLSTFKA